MTNQQPEALRLADELDDGDYDHTRQAADELRRLHDLLGKANALNRIRAGRVQKLEAANEQLLVFAQSLVDAWNSEGIPCPYEIVKSAQDAIAAASDETSR